MAWHAGVLAAIEKATGWDPRKAEVVVGTSAGAVTTASLRAGVSAQDHFDRATKRSREQWSLLEDALSGSLSSPRPWGTPTSLRLAVLGLLQSPPRPHPVLAGLLPRGRISLDPLEARLRRLCPTGWPDEPTWICTASATTGRLVVLGRDDLGSPVDLPRAVTASCAVPGVFAPVRIGDQELIDGGANSPTNAHLLAGLGFDLVIVSSPMSATRSAARSRWRGAVRLHHSALLAREVSALRNRGTRTLVFQPTASDLEVLGTDPLDWRRAPTVAVRAARSATDRLSLPDAREALRMLMDV